MKDVTYNQLGRALSALGFSVRVKTVENKLRVYEHEETGAFITIPPLPESDRVLEHHLVTARVTLDGFGIADPKVFDAKLQKAD